MPPDRKFRMNGIPMSRAPNYLKPYLDCVTGAMATGGVLDHEGKQSTVIWTLFRNGDVVGILEIELP